MTCQHPKECKDGNRCLRVVFGKPAEMDPEALKAGLVKLPDREETMWRIQWNHGRQSRFLGFGFARKKDAELAMKALIKCGINWQTTLRGVVQQISEFGTEKLRRVMIEALQW